MSSYCATKIVKYEHDDATKIGRETIMRRIRRASNESCGLTIVGAPTVMVVTEEELCFLRMQQPQKEWHGKIPVG